MSNIEHRTSNVEVSRTGLASAVAALCLVALAAPPTAGQAAPQEPSPFVRLYDTQTASAEPLPAEALAKRAGWALIPEKDTSRKLAGDGVLANDGIALVLRRGGAAAELFARAEAGWQARGVLIPSAAAGVPAGKLISIGIAENTQAAGMLEATFQTSAGRQATARFRLTTSVPIVEFRPGAGTTHLTVRDDIHRLVVPELLAYDYLVPRQLPHDWAALPAEYMLIALVKGGNAMAVCAWEGGNRNADAIAEGKDNVVCGFRLECPAGKGIWYSVIQARGIWHEQSPRQGALTALQWKPPFEAKWRCDFVRGIRHDSMDFAEAAAGDGSKGSMPGAWLEGEKAIVRLPYPLDSNSETNEDMVWPPLEMTVYPIDRTRKTPPEALCPVDVLRNALGAGVCQYVLDAEGLGGEASCTPAQVADWIERTFARKREAQSAEEIRHRLGEAKAHLQHLTDRMRQYEAAAQRLAKLCKEAGGSEDPATTDARKTVLDLLAPLLEVARWRVERPGLDRTIPQLMERMAEGVTKQIGKQEPAEEVRAWMANLREVGQAYECGLVEWRMLFRRIRADCRTMAAHDKKAAGFLAAVQKEAEEALRLKQ